MQMKVEPTQLRIRGAITIRDTKLRFALGYQYRQLHLLRMRVEEGALYPALHRLELRGLLASEWRTGRLQFSDPTFGMVPKK